MASQLLLPTLVVLFGCGSVVQTGINGNMGKEVGSPVLAASINFGVGTFILAVISFLSWWGWRWRWRQGSMGSGGAAGVSSNSKPKQSHLAWYELMGGVCGATAGCVTWGSAPYVGYSLAFVATLVGQLGGSLAWDHFGLCGDGDGGGSGGLPRRPLTLRKVLGAMTVTAGGVVCVLARIEYEHDNDSSWKNATTTEPKKQPERLPLIVCLCILLVLSGALIPTQAVVNARLNRRFVVKTTGSLVSFAVGFSMLVILSLVDGLTVGAGTAATASVTKLHWWSYTGGIFGASSVTGNMILSPILGVSLVLSCAVCGQLLCSLILDTVGAFGFERLPCSILRVLGVSLAFGGSILIHCSPVHDYEPIQEDRGEDDNNNDCDGDTDGSKL